MTNPTLSQVLESYAMVCGDANRPDVLAEYIGRFPHFEAELRQFVADRDEILFSSGEPRDADAEDRFVERVRRVRDAGMQPARIDSLTGHAKTKGLSRLEFARNIGFSVSLLQYFEKRRVEVSTVPPSVIRWIAETCGVGAAAVVEFLSSEPDAISGASFKHTSRPEAETRKSFADAVNEDQTLTPDEKQMLLTADDH